MSVQKSRVDKRAALARALAMEGYRDVYVMDHESAKKILTEKRRSLIEYLSMNEVESVRGIAEALDRDKASVSRDLKVLAEHDLVEYEQVGTRKSPRVKHETVIVEPIL